MADVVRCPRCAAPLVPERYESARLLACAAGHGALLTRAARPTLTVSARATLEHALESPRPGELACGACGAQAGRATAQRHGDSIDLDACAACGAVWFDAGEIARLHALPETPRAPSKAPRGASRLSADGEAVMPAAAYAIADVGRLVSHLLDGW